MRGVIWLVLLFATAVVAALTLGHNDGLVSVFFGGWRMDVSLNLTLAALLLAGFAIVSIIRGIDSLISLPERAREWRASRRERAAQGALREALAEFLGARYTRSQKAAQRALAIQSTSPDAPDAPDDPELRTLAQLLAASSAHRLLDRVRRDEQMEGVLQATRGQSTAAADGARLLAAEWAVDDRDAERALALLGELPRGAARRTQALRLKMQAQRQQRLPLEALHTARLLAKHQGFSSAAAQGLLRSLAFEALDTAHDVDQLRRVWQQFDPQDRDDLFVCARGATRAAALGAEETGRQWLRPHWERLSQLSGDERAQVALALGNVSAGIGGDWLPRAEAALGQYPQDPAVALAVGCVFAHRQLWGKAKRPLEQAANASALSGRDRRQAWRWLARLAQEEGDQERAIACEHEAAQID